MGAVGLRLYKRGRSVLMEHQGLWYSINEEWDRLINRGELYHYLVTRIPGLEAITDPEVAQNQPDPPIGSQEVWAAGVTYLRSKDARMAESEDAAGGSFYDKVYHATRPELFFKSSAGRVVGPGGRLHIRRDSNWNVPEPELTLFINSEGQIQGYTIGNDMSSRSIEGENPLYLPQAKVYDNSTGLGPCLFVAKHPGKPETSIAMTILREGKPVFEESISLEQMKRSLEDLVEHLFLENSFPDGVYLMTGTGLVPPDDFTLLPGDEVHIAMDPVGTLKNIISQKS